MASTPSSLPHLCFDVGARDSLLCASVALESALGFRPWPKGGHRSVLFMRSAERVDRALPNWIDDCFVPAHHQPTTDNVGDSRASASQMASTAAYRAKHLYAPNDLVGGFAFIG